MALQSITLKQVDEIINDASKNNKLWHYNGGQAYIQVSATTLMVLDHTVRGNVSIQMFDGTSYFREYNGMQYAVSDSMSKSGSHLSTMFDLV